MSYDRDRNEFIHLFMKYAPMANDETEWQIRRKAMRLLRYATTHVRIETELTNGYKDKDGNWDKEQTERSIRKRDHIDKQMEAIAPIVYGALTVSVRMNDREIYIPVRER